MQETIFGRVGGLTLVYAAISGTGKTLSKLPQERTTVEVETSLLVLGEFKAVRKCFRL